MMACWRGRNTFVYSLFDASGDCLYVGLTCGLKTRWEQHQRTNPEMATHARRCRVSGPYRRDVAARIENEQQLFLKPRYNAPWSRLRLAPSTELVSR